MEPDATRYSRYRRIVEVAHSQAFQLMRYQAEDSSEALVWNSRDGEAPTEFSYDGRQYRFRSAKEAWSAVLPARAELVIVSYTREMWRAWAECSWGAACKRDPTYRDRMPTVESFLRVATFEHGLPRVISRHQYLQETHEWSGRIGAEI